MGGFFHILICTILVLCLVASSAGMPKSGRKKGSTARSGRQQADRRTVVSCRVFRKGVCKKTAKNIILVNKSIANSYKCQQFCYATAGCAAFTHFEQTKSEAKKCVLFRDCNGKLSDCKNCISGPIMPRITECLAARQEVAPEEEQETNSGKPCSFGCSGVCVGPKCPELLSGINGVKSPIVDGSEGSLDGSEGSVDSIDGSLEPRIGDTNEQGNTDSDDSEYGDESDYYDDATDDYDYNYDTEDAVDEGSGSDYSDTYEAAEEDAGDDYDFDYAAEDNIEVDVPLDLPLDEDALDEPEEEQEEVDVNIDEGFLSDSSGNVVDVPSVEARANVANPPSANTGGNTFIFFFCALGGTNNNGAINIVDMINTGLGNAAQALTIAPVPSAAMRGGEVSSAYTGSSITTCGNGFTILSPYGYIYKPGVCYDYNLHNNGWESTGAALTSFRRGATITKLGRYLLATGGVRQKRALNTVEVFDPKKPKSGWKRLAKLEMPVPVSEHCTVTLEGRNGKEVVITGGKGREKRAMRLDVKSQKWYSMNRLTTGRRKHACVKASINGRPGLVVSGGRGRGNSNMTSVEFFDSRTGQWLSLPPLRKGRRGHVMTVTKGKLMVAGGEGVGRGKKEYLDDMEIFNGKRWVPSKQKLDRPRSNFSLVKIPDKKTQAKNARNSSQKPRRKSKSKPKAKKQRARGSSARPRKL